MQRFLTLLLISILVFFGYRKRYRLLNFVLSSQAVRGLAVRSFFSMPFVRERLLKQMFQY
ncbi:hypothetical protein ACFOU2_05090 [Bacillus songklensis]|uniref:Uncharacterized protein n=1 Tax=Bacillus songklensis TaxID=1069116 RepID=A0ABV8B175_9BACI